MRNGVLLNTIIKNAIYGIITINEDGIIKSINPSACMLFRYEPEEVIEKDVSILIAASDKERYYMNLTDYYKSEIHINYCTNTIGRRKDGNTFPFRFSVSEVQDGKERIFAGFIHDLSHQKEAEKQLMEYNLHLEKLVKDRTIALQKTIKALTEANEELNLSLKKEKELGKLKTRLLSTASHEFKTPLSSIQLSASLLEKYTESGSNTNISKHIGKIKNAVNNLNAILNDFLHIEKIEAGKIEVSRSNFDLSLFAKEIVEDMQLLAKEGQSITHRHYGYNEIVYLDKSLLKNCIINLISNAIKYSGEKSTITFETGIDSTNYLIRISDNGIGIPSEDHKHLFKAFFRAQNTGSIPGTGLGLNIAKRSVKLMNGNIDFESALNQGTTFTITFPHHD